MQQGSLVMFEEQDEYWQPHVWSYGHTLVNLVPKFNPTCKSEIILASVSSINIRPPLTFANNHPVGLMDRIEQIHNAFVQRMFQMQICSGSKNIFLSRPTHDLRTECEII